MDNSENRQTVHWFAMRDLTRSNAKNPAYKLLESLRFELFTPMVRKVVTRQGRRITKEVPFMHDLLFVHDSRENLDSVVDRTPTLQYRYVRGGFCKPMTVPDDDMNRFIAAVTDSPAPRFFRPDEITPDMLGRKIRILGGNLDGYEGRLLSVRGARRKRVLVELPNLMTAAVEVNADLIRIDDDEDDKS
ncbi:MAG: UpxY family transcription antiterminator [Alistipes sp.]|nr:UpxY family transcription antiterminator [Alistipes sp.]